MSRTSEMIYSKLIRLSSRRETNPDGVIQSREVAELLMAVDSVHLAFSLGIEHNDTFEARLKESIQCRHPFSFFLKSLRRKK